MHLTVAWQAKFGEDGKPGFFAIASAPGIDKENGAVELLIKAQGGTAEQLCAAAAGALLAWGDPQAGACRHVALPGHVLQRWAGKCASGAGGRPASAGASQSGRWQGF